MAPLPQEEARELKRREMYKDAFGAGKPGAPLAPFVSALRDFVVEPVPAQLQPQALEALRQSRVAALEKEVATAVQIAVVMQVPFGDTHQKLIQ